MRVNKLLLFGMHAVRRYVNGGLTRANLIKIDNVSCDY